MHWTAGVHFPGRDRNKWLVTVYGSQPMEPFCHHAQTGYPVGTGGLFPGSKVGGP